VGFKCPQTNETNESNKSNLFSDTTHGEPEAAVVEVPVRSARIDVQAVRARGIGGRTRPRVTAAACVVRVPTGVGTIAPRREIDRRRTRNGLRTASVDICSTGTQPTTRWNLPKTVGVITSVRSTRDIAKSTVIANRNKFVLGPSGSGKSFFMNHLVRQYYEQGAHVVLVDTGNSYQGLCGMIRRKTGGADGVYFTYTEDKPISFNPFYTDDYIFDVEKKDSIKTLLLTLWKSEDDKVTKTESGELGSAVSAYIERIQSDRSIVPSFNTFYEYMRDDYRKELAQRDIKVEKSDFNIDNMLTTMRQYYRGGRYDFLLNSTENIDLLGKRFIVFEIDSIKENRELFPVVTIIIMEAFINKMRRLKGVRKQLIVEEAWKALSSANMAEYLRYMYKTVRKYYGEAIVVTQEVDDIISSPVVKESIINNSDCKILLDQRKYMNKFDQIQALLGLTEKEKSQILSINMANNPSRLYKEVWIGLGGTQSAVYATEVSAEEYLAYTTEETEKVEVYRLAEKLGDDIEAAIRQLAERRRNKE